MSFLKSHGLDLELLAARAGRLVPRARSRNVDADLERELERRQDEERKTALERASRKRED
jgi:hypothetical protein